MLSPVHASPVRMRGARLRPVVLRTLVALGVVAAVAPLAAWAGDTLTGRWTLVEQRYEKGRADVARPGVQLELELVFEAGPVGPRAHVLFDARNDTSFEWPAAPADGEPVPLTALERTIDLGNGRARATYRIDPPAGTGAWSLIVTEEYAVDGDGRLAGTMSVRMEADGRPRGGYVLHRRFERAR